MTTILVAMATLGEDGGEGGAKAPEAPMVRRPWRYEKKVRKSGRKKEQNELFDFDFISFLFFFKKKK